MSSQTSTATLYPPQGFGAPKNRHAHARESNVGLPAGTEVFSADNHISIADDIFYDRFPDDLKDKAVDYTILREEANQSRNLYEDLLGKLKEAGVLQGLKASNLTVVDPAGSLIEDILDVSSIVLGKFRLDREPVESEIGKGSRFFFTLPNGIDRASAGGNLPTPEPVLNCVTVTADTD